VTASKSGRGDHEAVRIKVEETDEGVTICAIYPNQVGDSCHDRETRKNQRRNNNDNNVEVDFVVRVPEGVRFVGRPVGAQSNSTTTVFRARAGDSVAERVPVRFGKASVNQIVVLEGLEPGDVVALADTTQWSGKDRIVID